MSVSECWPPNAALTQPAHQTGIIPALESAHAIFHAIKLAEELGPGKEVVVCVSGRGDKDIDTVRSSLAKFGCSLRMRSAEDLE